MEQSRARGWLLSAVALLLALGAPACAESERAAELVAGASQRIEQHRKGDIRVVVLDRGSPVPGAAVEIAQTGHEFLFGCNIYELRPTDHSPAQRAYQERFVALFNYATLPFYWDSFEGERGKTDADRLRAMARWCTQRGIRTKGHPLVWHAGVPGWVPGSTRELATILRQRVYSIVSGFAGLVDTWDVINESTVSAQSDNPVGLWVKEIGAAEAAGQSLAWAREGNSKATLIVNDFNVSPAYEAQIRSLATSGRAPDAIGIQSHMHRGEWPLEQAWQVCETFGRLGLPLHFTETTVLSGHLKTDEDWQSYHPDWRSTPAGEQRQAEYVERLYRVLFSHPAVAAITWWDFSDLEAWQAAPAGLLRKDMSPKPIYERLLRMVKGEWWTRVSSKTDSEGEVKCRGFYGAYVITATAPDGRTVSKDVRLFKDDPRRVALELPLS
jgi:GH35 family endo-1,4-beta-xylanase